MILHKQLEKDCIVLGKLNLCAVLLMPDANYPWLILVPQRENISEIYELSDADQQQLIRESSQVSRLLVELFDADKINVAALGNMVPQLHVHHVARYKTDAAWPAPVWGAVKAKEYSDKALGIIQEKLKNSLGF
ncbi:MAG: diadenosine tetraphosphate hydrolase [Proteobacteria bacterium]|nr:MAG: diadenosine tetraphosphate hydrolase [Pseudomonadota bacterium]